MVAHRSRDRALYLLGEVSEVDGDSNLRGSFAFHPFNIVMALIPFVIAALVWTWGSRTVWEMIFIAAIFAAELIVVLSVRRARAREEHEIVDFILGLFPNARQHRRRVFGPQVSIRMQTIDSVVLGKSQGNYNRSSRPYPSARRAEHSTRSVCRMGGYVQTRLSEKCPLAIHLSD